MVDAQDMGPEQASDALPAGLSPGRSFEQAAQAVLRYLSEQVPLGFWSVTRVENGRQTYLALDENAYGLTVGGSHPWESSYCVHMAAGRAPAVAPDAQAVPLYAAAGVNEALPVGAYAGAPVHEPDGTLFGAICGLDASAQDGASPLATAGPLLALLGELLTVVLASERAREQAASQAVRAELAAERDALTGLHNRRAWDRMLGEEQERFRALGDPTVVVLLDLDRMKQINDTAGHAAGDEHLRRAARALSEAVRSSDVVARLGGDEFALLLRGCEEAVAPDRVAAVSAALNAVGVQASAGWSALRPGHPLPHALHAADEAMYAAKRARRLPPSTRTRPDLIPATRGADVPQATQG